MVAHLIPLPAQGDPFGCRGIAKFCTVSNTGEAIGFGRLLLDARCLVVCAGVLAPVLGGWLRGGTGAWAPGVGSPPAQGVLELLDCTMHPSAALTQISAMHF